MATVMVMRTVLTTVTIIHLRTKYDLRLSTISVTVQYLLSLYDLRTVSTKYSL